MQPSFKRNIILILESIFAFIILQLLHFLIGKYNPILLGSIFVMFSASIFLTTLWFVRRRERKYKILGLNIQTELSI